MQSIEEEEDEEDGGAAEDEDAEEAIVEEDAVVASGAFSDVSSAHWGALLRGGWKLNVGRADSSCSVRQPRATARAREEDEPDAAGEGERRERGRALNEAAGAKSA